MPEASLFADRPEWADVVPIPQHDPGATPVAPIFYTEAYKDATDYFRGVVAQEEKSKRVLELTETIINMNPAHYSAWQYRWQTLVALDAPLEEELRLMDDFATLFLKTYQVWHHRRLLLTRLSASTTATSVSSTPSSSETKTSTSESDPLALPTAELTFVSHALRADTKNYHTWAYRQWLLAHFASDALWARELPFVEELLAADVRNNSAWSHRFAVVFKSGVHEGEEDRETVLRRELAFAKEKIALAPNNASAWNYLRGVLDHTKTPYGDLAAFALPYTKPQPASDSDANAEVVDLDDPRPSSGADLPCPYAIEFLADVYEEKGGESLQKAIELWKSLAREHDTIRKAYWEHRINEATHQQ